MNLGWSSKDRSGMVDLRPLSSHCGGGEEEDHRSSVGFCRSTEWEEVRIASIFESSLPVAQRWLWASSPLTILAERRPLQDLVLVAA
jgi:hypothetical protein